MSQLKPWLSNRNLPRRLRTLIGSWSVDGHLVSDPTKRIRGTTTIRWLAKDALVVMRGRMSGGVPVSCAVIGADDKNNTYTMLYSDERGVVRRYEMTLTARRWTMLRKARGFSQRFKGTIAANGRTIRATWEKSLDGRRWELDLRLTYTKHGARSARARRK